MTMTTPAPETTTTSARLDLLPSYDPEVRVVGTPTPGNLATKSEGPNSAAQVLSGRIEWGKHFEQTVARDPSLRPDEVAAKRAVHMANYDRAAAADGFVVKAVDPAVAEHDRKFGIEQVTPASYQGVHLAQSAHLPFDRLTGATAAMCEFAAGLQMPPELGKSFIEQLSKVGAEVSHLKGQHEQDSYAAEETKKAVAHYGSTAAQEEAVKRVEKLLASLPNNPIAAQLPKSLASRNSWVLRTLDGWAQHIESYQKGRPR